MKAQPHKPQGREGVIYRSRKDSCRPRELSFGLDLFTLSGFVITSNQDEGKEGYRVKVSHCEPSSSATHSICLSLMLPGQDQEDHARG